MQETIIQELEESYRESRKDEGSLNLLYLFFRNLTHVFAKTMKTFWLQIQTTEDLIPTKMRTSGFCV